MKQKRKIKKKIIIMFGTHVWLCVPMNPYIPHEALPPRSLKQSFPVWALPPGPPVGGGVPQLVHLGGTPAGPSGGPLP